MSLLSRVQAATECAVVDCHEPRIPDAQFGRDCGHLTDAWRNRLDRQDDGTFVPRHGLAHRNMRAKDTTAWVA